MHRMPKTILKGQSARMVYVLPKFVLGHNEKLEIELREKGGGRKIRLLK
jgi:hypothetical protein